MKLAIDLTGKPLTVLFKMWLHDMHDHIGWRKIYICLGRSMQRENSYVKLVIRIE